jgi:acyl carrier protein
MRPSQAEIERRVLFSVEAFGVSGHAVGLSTSIDDLGIDAPDLVEITDLAKQEWGIDIATDAFDGASTVGDLVGVISSRVGEA